MKRFAAVLLFATTSALYADQAPPTHDLTQQFQSAGVQVKGLRAVEVGGILLLRGDTDDPAKSIAAAEYAQSLGYKRIANLIRLVDAPDDAKIERTAERQLATRTLDGCTFRVESNHGVVTVGGKVHHELQKDIAMSILRGIDGVREIRASLQR